MEGYRSSNRIIAKNTLMLYIRMFLVIIIGLYTSRVVLDVLGVEDYGIYGIVGSVVAMMGFLNSSMSGATSRFLTYELGNQNTVRQNKVFSSALIIHLGIALVVLLVCETLGLWWLNNKLVIPPNRMEAAQWVFQLSIITAVIGIIQVPFSATVIAQERMDVYAYIEILNVVLKLLIVFLLTLGSMERLILYGLLTLAVSFTVLLTYYFYCINHFEETRFKWVWDKKIIIPMLSFSGWDLFGNFAVTGRQQGTNFLINIFFGVVYNAASSVATTVNGMLSALCQNILTAFRPRIIKLYSANESNQSVNLLMFAAKIATVLMVLVAVPLSFEMEFIMKIWLKNPPEYAVLFCRIMLISSCINMGECVLNIGIHATGNIRKMSILTGCCYLGVLPVIWLCYKFGMPVETAYYLSYLVCTCNLFIRGFVLQKLIPEFSFGSFIKNVALPVLFVAIVIVGFSLLLTNSPDCTIRFVIIFFCDFIIGGLLALFVIFDKSQRESLLSYLRSRLVHADK